MKITRNDNFKLNSLQKPYPFETLLIKNGKIVLLNEHLERLSFNIKINFIYMKIDINKIKKEIEDYSSKIGDLKKDKFYGMRIVLMDEELIISLRDIKMRNQIYELGKVKEIRCLEVLRQEINKEKFTRGYKISPYKNNTEGIAKIREEGFFEGLLFGIDGNLISGYISNIFLFKGGELLTPKLTSEILPGITRKKIINIFSAEENKLTIKDVIDCDYLLYTNSLIGIIAIENTYKNSNPKQRNYINDIIEKYRRFEEEFLNEH